MKNPFDGVTPDVTVFGTELSGALVLVLSGVWGFAMLVTAIYAAIGGAKWAAARQSARSEEMTEAAGKLKIALIAFGVLVALPLLFGAIILIFG